MKSSPSPRIDDPILVRSRLEELGLTEDLLLDPIRAGLGAAAACTDNHPSNFAGTVLWGESVRALRDGLAERGWTRSDIKGFPTVVSPDSSMAIAIQRGDEHTGSCEDDVVPSTKYPKGVVTMQVVEHNQFLPFEDLPVPGIPSGVTRATWFLLHSRQGERIICELSLPTAINSSGFVETFDERIILSPIDLDPARMPVVNEEPVSPVVDVKPRAAAG